MAVVQWFKDVLQGTRKRHVQRQFYKKIDEQLKFVASEALTLGVEFELALLEADTLLPAHKGPEIVTQCASPQIKKELFDHMVEVTSIIGKNVHETETQLRQELGKLSEVCAAQNLLITGTGRPPSIKQVDFKRIPDARYVRLEEERRIMVERFGTLGMHIHLGMTDAGQCIRYNNFFMGFLPHLIALSASSPFEDGVNTGLASIRPTTTESMPIAGMPYHFQSWQEYVGLVHAMYKAGSIEDLKDLWWDLRPCPRYGTLEIRVCDQPATIAGGLAIVAFVHSLALWFQEHQSWLDEVPQPNAWRLRENKWRAMRYGLDAKLVINNEGDTLPLCDDVRLWLGRLQPFIEQYNYTRYIEMLKKIMLEGNSAQRQQALWSANQDMDAIAQFNCDEFAVQAPLWNRVKDAGPPVSVEKERKV